MKKSFWKIGIALASIGIVLLGAFVLVSQSAQVKKAATYSSAVSLDHELSHSDVLASLGIRVSTEWRPITPDEYERIVSELFKRRLLDKGMGEVRDGKQLFDPWGAPYQIAVRKDSSGQIEVVAWSQGRDGRSKTADDVCSPVNGLERLPPAFFSTSKK